MYRNVTSAILQNSYLLLQSRFRIASFRASVIKKVQPKPLLIHWMISWNAFQYHKVAILEIMFLFSKSWKLVECGVKKRLFFTLLSNWWSDEAMEGSRDASIETEDVKNRKLLNYNFIVYGICTFWVLGVSARNAFSQSRVDVTWYRVSVHRLDSCVFTSAVLYHAIVCPKQRWIVQYY